MDLLQVRGNQIVDASGQPVRLRGACIGGWMNMENFLNGYPGAEHTLRATVANVLGPAKAEFLFEQWLDNCVPNESYLTILRKHLEGRNV